MKNSTLYLTLIIVFIFSLYLFTRNDDHRFVSSFDKVESPLDNPLTIQKIELGRKLFFDKRLSIIILFHVPLVMNRNMLLRIEK